MKLFTVQIICQTAGSVSHCYSFTTHLAAAQCNLFTCSHWQSHKTVSQVQYYGIDWQAGDVPITSSDEEHCLVLEYTASEFGIYLW